jgi:hypothetical protein
MDILRLDPLFEIFLLGDALFIMLLVFKYILKNLCRLLWIGVIAVLVFMFLEWYESAINETLPVIEANNNL